MNTTDFVSDLALTLRSWGVRVEVREDNIYFPDTPRLLRMFFSAPTRSFFMTWVEEGCAERQYDTSPINQMPDCVYSIDFMSKQVMFYYEREVLGETKASLKSSWRFGWGAESEKALVQEFAANAKKIAIEAREIRRLRKRLVRQLRVSPTLAWGTTPMNKISISGLNLFRSGPYTTSAIQ